MCWAENLTDFLMNAELRNTRALGRVLRWTENSGNGNWYHSMLTIQ